MNLRKAVLGVLAGAVSLTFAPAVFAQGPPPPYGYQDAHGRQEPWEAPPGEYRDEITRRGFHDGIQGARRDYENHRRPDVNNRDEFRHPRDIPHEARRQYRDAFRRGYNAGVQHMMNEGGEHRDHDHDHDHDHN
jgi:hypothetical protein